MLENKIIQGCLNNESYYQKKLVERYSPMLMTTCRRYNSDINSCKDILQETFIKIFKNIHKHDRNKKFLSWAHRICINESLTHIRKNKKYNYEILKGEYGLAQDAISFSNMNMEHIIFTIAKLPPQYRTVFNLIAIDGYNHNEVANLLNISPATSRSNYSRAKVKLKELLIQTEVIRYERYK